jgi:hypothetical protein
LADIDAFLAIQSCLSATRQIPRNAPEFGQIMGILSRPGNVAGQVPLKYGGTP